MALIVDRKEQQEPKVVLGLIAGVVGGLAASWVMNQFMAGPAKKLKQAVQSDEQNWKDDLDEFESKSEPKEDATMKAADAIVHAATGGQHLSWEAKQKGGPVVHYTFGALMGGVYGGLAEVAPVVTTGFGLTFGSALFGGADLLAVPALKLAPPESGKITPALISPFTAHLIYGVTTEVVRRTIRAIL